MTEIKVILDSGPTIDIGALSREERDLLFDQIAEENPSIPRHVIDSFSDMQNELIHDEILLAKPELKELLLRKIIQLSQSNGSEFNTNIIPIIPNFTINTIHKTGGAIPLMRRFKPAERKPTVKEEVPGAIRVRFDSQIFAVTTTGLDYIAPPNEELTVIGLLINTYCSDISLDNKQITAISINKPAIGAKILVGNYKYTEASKSCDDYFFHPDYSVNIDGEPTIKPIKILFNELDEPKVIAAMNKLFDYLSNIRTYHKGDESAYFVYAQVDAALAGGKSHLAIQKSLADLISDITTKKQIAPVISEAMPKSDILTLLETVHKGTFSTVYNGAIAADIDMRGFSDIYYRSIVKGKDDPSVTEKLSIYKERQSRLAFQRAIKIKLLSEYNKLNAYKIIIEKKLGVKRLAEIEQELIKKPSLTVAAKNILELLKPNERKPIELEYERKQKYLEAVLNNKCPHVKLYRQFRNAKENDRAKKFYFDLSKFFKNKGESNSMIQCNNCGFDIVCPHVRDFTEMEFAQKPYSEIKAKLTKYIDKAVVKDQYYCKICGEMISSLDAFDGVGETRDVASTMNEELKNFMWGEIAINSKYLKFGNLVDVPKLITTIRDACYPYIFEIEKQILKSKTNSAEEIKAKKRLFVTIYAFAYMIHLILSNRGRAGENEISFKNFKSKGAKSEIVDMIRHVLEIIIMTKNVAIREIPGMSADLIKNKLIEAYKSIQSTGTQVITYSGEAEDILITLMLDPTYKFLYKVNIIDDMLSGKLPKKSKLDIVDKIDYVMGEPIAKLEKEKDIFTNVRIPKFDKWNLKAFDNIQSMKSGKTTSDNKYIYDTAEAGYLARSFEIFNDKLKLQLYKEPLYVDISAGKRDDPTAMMDVKFREPFEKHQAKFIELEKKETMLYQYKALMAAKNYTRPGGKNSRQWIDPGVGLGRVYDEDGNKHNWNIYIVEKTVDEKPVRIELKSSDIAKDTEKGIKFTDNITDKKCSVCGILFSQCDKLEDTKIVESLNTKHTISNFFRFYENRCPKGGLHDYGKGVKCSKCGIDSAYILKPDDKQSMNYYREYRDIYKKERDEFAVLVETEKVVALPPKDVSNFGTEYAKWTPNFNIILDLANKLKINHRFLSALGSVEKQEYTEVANGHYIPPEPESTVDTRIYLVDTYIKNLITEYNQLKFFNRLVKPPIELSQMIDNSGINKHKIADLATMLPDIYAEYNDRFAYFQRYKRPREVVMFCVQTFCEMLLRIHATGDANTMRLRHDFVAYFVKKTLRYEELTTKAGQFNWSLLYGDKDKEPKVSDSNYTESYEDESEQKYLDEAEEESDEFGDTGRPMEADLDVETDPDADPDDDPSNQIRVGENYGLD
ncbi:Hypothetical protein PACV_169 [Pacmanvirus A23]|uniref:Hypothetical protein n=1 Tax=Pacmanvirus A23 TaxID=1932881 RepID=UPI000A0923AA|nr:Hypothetical protein B9W72_gp167 [Pacmanvirus A23]SIP85884.1 Hypothetical protein PACV_169 [Pacmanvirus A23]